MNPLLADVLFVIKSGTNPSEAKKSIIEFLGEEFLVDMTNVPLFYNNPDFIQPTFIYEVAVTFLVSRSRTELGKKLNLGIHKQILPTIRKNELAQLLNMSVSSFYRAIAQLKEQKIIVVEDRGFRIKNCLLQKQAMDSQNCETFRKNDNGFAKPLKDSSSPQTRQNNQTF